MRQKCHRCQIIAVKKSLLYTLFPLGPSCTTHYVRIRTIFIRIFCDIRILCGVCQMFLQAEKEIKIQLYETSLFIILREMLLIFFEHFLSHICILTVHLKLDRRCQSRV